MNVNGEGYQALQRYFGLSYASWVVIPRAFMQEMPDKWQADMAKLLEQLNRKFQNAPQYSVSVSLKRDGKFVSIPDWVDYRYPEKAVLKSFMRTP